MWLGLALLPAQKRTLFSTRPLDHTFCLHDLAATHYYTSPCHRGAQFVALLPWAHYSDAPRALHASIPQRFGFLGALLDLLGGVWLIESATTGLAALMHMRVGLLPPGWVGGWRLPRVRILGSPVAQLLVFIIRVMYLIPSCSRLILQNLSTLYI